MRSSLALLSLISTSAAAYELRTDSQGDVVRWRNEVRFVVDPKLAVVLGEPSALEAVRAAVDEVNGATPALGVSFSVGPVRGPGYELDAAAKNQNEVLALTDWPYAKGAIASTVVTLNARTNEILDTDIVLNAQDHTFRVLTAPLEPGQDLDDVQNAVTHELGHALGLMHNPRDQRLVMYPSAPAGEISKRVLQDDDRAGLAALYQQALVEPAPGAEVQMGCSSTGSTGGVALALAAMVVLLGGRRARVGAVVSRRRGLSALTGLVAVGLGGSAFADEPLAVGVVRARVSHRSAQYPGLIVTSLDVELEACATPGCERATRVTVPGGRLGELEQVVEHHPVPAVNERLGLVKKSGRWLLFRLADDEQRTHFERLRVGSESPQRVRDGLTQPVQPVVPAK